MSELLSVHSTSSASSKSGRLIPFPASSGSAEQPLTSEHAPSILAPARAIKRRGPCLNRRTGQNGNVFQHNTAPKTWNPNAPAYGRYWEDTSSGLRRRKTVPLGRCRTRTIAKQKLRGYLTGHKVNDVETFHRTTAPGLTFRAQAKVWLESLRTRRRRPPKPASIEN